MENLKIQEELRQNTISSREVAEMLGLRHDNMLRKIEGIDGIIQNSNLSSDDYWYETSYKSGTGKNYREYRVTKKGCELIAHKTEGEKGVIFTVRYMERFEAMENMLKTGVTNNFNVAKEEIELFEATARVLKLNDNSKLACVHSIYENNGLRHDYLPQYTESF